MAIHYLIHLAGEASHAEAAKMARQEALLSRGLQENWRQEEQAAPYTSGSLVARVFWHSRVSQSFRLLKAVGLGPLIPQHSLGGSYLGGCVRDGRGGRTRKIQDTLLPQAATMQFNILIRVFLHRWICGQRQQVRNGEH